MSEFVEREELIAEMQHPKIEINDGQDFANWYSHCIRTVPAADVAPVVHGRWIYSRTESEMAVDKCSICEKEQFAISGVVSQGNYCPNCGAKMDGESEESNGE